MSLINNIFILSEMPDPMDLATGLEKRELLAYQAGNDVRLNYLNYHQLKTFY